MRYAAFLRAINVGKHNRIRMADLCALLQASGLRDVETYLQSGNIAFEAEGEEEVIAQRIETVLSEHGLGGASVVLRTGTELAEVVKVLPFAPTPAETFHHYVLFARHPLPRFDALPTEGVGATVVALREREILVGFRRDVRDPKLPPALVDALKSNPVTARYRHVVEAFTKKVRL